MTRRELRTCLDEKGMTISTLAHILGVDDNYARGWLLGEHPIPNRVVHYLRTSELVVRHRGVCSCVTKSDEADRFRAAIARMCEACEPELRECRDRTCPLITVSPFPLSKRQFGDVNEKPPIFDGIASDEGTVHEATAYEAYRGFPRLLDPFAPTGGGMI